MHAVDLIAGQLTPLPGGWYCCARRFALLHPTVGTRTGPCVLCLAPPLPLVAQGGLCSWCSCAFAVIPDDCAPRVAVAAGPLPGGEGVEPSAYQDMLAHDNVMLHLVRTWGVCVRRKGYGGRSG